MTSTQMQVYLNVCGCRTIGPQYTSEVTVPQVFRIHKEVLQEYLGRKFCEVVVTV